MNNKVVIGGNLKLKNVVSGTPKNMIQVNGTGGGGGITDAVKEALLDCFEHVAWIDDEGQTYYQALYDALYAKTVVSISAVFEQGAVVIYDDDTLDDLKQYLTVTAHYDDSTTAVITTGYTLSGTLNPGTSTITVTYEGKKAYFTVAVTHRPGTVTITNNLTGCTNSNSASSATEGNSYSGTISASSGYTLTGATVSITMDGTDITSTAYNNGMISIAEVTGSLVITITAVAVTLVSISAVYTQSGTVYDTDTLNSLKTDLVVTATYSDSSTATVPSADYTLSGTLTAGTSTITVTYSGKTTTFTVTVTHDTKVFLYNWDFTQSLTDTVQSAVATIDSMTSVKPTRDSDGVHITADSEYINLGQIYDTGITVEVDFGTMNRKGVQNGRLLMVGDQAANGLGTGFIYRNNNTWNWYASGSWDTAVSGTTDSSLFSNKTLKAVFDASGHMAVYCDDTLIGTSTRTFAKSAGTYMQIGAYSGSGGYTCYYDMIVKAVRVYTEE